MNKMGWYIFLAIIIIVLVIFYCNRYFSPDSKYIPVSGPVPSTVSKTKQNFNGICIFDIDGTLTPQSREENEIVVDYAIKRGYAVGISTAGSIYNPNNLLSYEWMPRNLHNFMSNMNFVTFNNVASGILAGRDGREYYDQIGSSRHINWGHKKGLSLQVTADVMGIDDYSNVIMFDNDPLFLEGMREHNADYKLICVGEPCGGGALDLDKLKYALSNWV